MAKGCAAIKLSSIESIKQPDCIAEKTHTHSQHIKSNQQQQPQPVLQKEESQKEPLQQQQQQIQTKFMGQVSAIPTETSVVTAQEKEDINHPVKQGTEQVLELSPQVVLLQETILKRVVDVAETSGNAPTSTLAGDVVEKESTPPSQGIENPVEIATDLESAHESTPDETDRSAVMMDEKEEVDIGVPRQKQKQEDVTAITANEEPSEKKSEAGEGEPLSTVSSPSTVAASLIDYKDGQWSPSNPDGKRQYNREQLLQLREAKASRVQPEVKNVSILPHPNLMPLFMRNNNNNNNNKRVQSMVGLLGGGNRGGSGNDAGGNFVGKQVSMSGVQGGRSSMKGMIHVNLSLNQDVKLNETENAWRPRQNKVLDNDNNGASDSKSSSVHEKDELIRRVRGILNKLTPERFDTLVEEIIKLKIDTQEKMDEVIVLVFEKAIDEPNFSVSYARLCHRLISEVKARDERMESGTKSNLQHFRNALLDKTEREFTHNVSQSTAKEKKLQPLVDKIKKCPDPNEKAELEALLEEEERKIRRRSGGTVRFIGELFKISMLTGKIIYSCIDTLLNPHSEDMLECLCKLLTTVGAKFEQTPVNAKDPGRCYSLEKSISRMQAIASKTDKDGAKVSSRVRFMLQDVIDLRKNKWQSTRNEAPKTMGQIEKEAKNEQLSAQYMNYSGSLSTSGSASGNNSSQSGGVGKRDDRRGGYGDNRSAGYGGSHSQRGGGDGGARGGQQNLSSGGNANSGGNSGGGNNNNSHSNGNSDDNTWHVQTGKGSRSQAVDTNKLEGLVSIFMFHKSRYDRRASLN